MSKHLFGLIVTPHGTAANNRGENEGNITTLQKLLWNGEIHTCVSAEAIRWAVRYYWQMRLANDVKVNRQWIEGDAVPKPYNKWEDAEFKEWSDFIDDDVLGFMSAEAAKEETNEKESEKPSKRERKRGKAIVRRGRLEVTRAVSLAPFAGDITFNAASVGATPSASRTGTDPVPYGAEIHATRYQYGFALTPESLKKQARALDVVDALTSLSEVAGNHSRFLYDFSPDSVIFRWTEDFAPRFLYGFEMNGGGVALREDVWRRIRAGDINPKELVVGGSLAASPQGAELKTMGAHVVEGVKAAADEVKRRMR